MVGTEEVRWELGGGAWEERVRILMKHAKGGGKRKSVYIGFVELLEQCASKLNDLKQKVILSQLRKLKV